jgi:3-deoxy-D-manno-octulosonate 8-phosphate phosphatase (KDO 8-P phosphatase)
MQLIKAVALDVDGVLTDGTFWWGAHGEEFKRFSFADVMGVSLGRKAGLVFALISGEESAIVDRFALKMGIQDVYKNCKDKASALRSFAQAYGLDLSEVCFMGDDVNDLTALRLAGLAAAPSTAHSSVLTEASFVTHHAGGQGAVRELVDVLIAKHGQPTVNIEGAVKQ